MLALLEHERLKEVRSRVTPLPPKPTAVEAKRPASSPPPDATFLKQQISDSDTIPEDIPVKNEPERTLRRP